MTQLTAATSFNVEASLNAWLGAGLAAFSRPSWLATLPALVYDVPQITASVPCFALVHIPVNLSFPYMGGQVGDAGKGGRMMGILDVSCYVSRSKSGNWLMQIRTMRDMVLSLANSTSAIVLQDYSTPQTPVETAYKVNIDGATITATEADKNPDIERARVLIDYSYTFRS